MHYNVLSQAARNGDETRIQRHIRSFDLEKPVRLGLTPLSSALSENDPALIKILVNAGANTEVLLSSAISENNPAIIRVLVDAGADTLVLYECLKDNMEDILAKSTDFDAILEVLNPITVEQDRILHLSRYKAISQAVQCGD